MTLTLSYFLKWCVSTFTCSIKNLKKFFSP